MDQHYVPTCLNHSKILKQKHTQYKKHNTVKFLIAMTPCMWNDLIHITLLGGMSLILLIESIMWVCSLQLLEPGDLVADGGFNIEKDLNFYNAKLQNPVYSHTVCDTTIEAEV